MRTESILVYPMKTLRTGATHEPDRVSWAQRVRALVSGRVGVACLLLWCGGLTVAQDQVDTDDGSLEDLLSLIQTETDLATRTGMNADFVPGMATILSGSDLMVRGVRTVWEALALVPGMTQGLEMTGERQILSRGVGFGYASGNIKYLLDGVSMNSTLFATANPVLNMPIEQIERIEVIRGPGASIHGEYAFAGVVNVITRRRERTLHAQARERADQGGGAIWHWSDPDRDLVASINLAGLSGDGGVPVAEDALYPLGDAALSNAPGRSNESHRYRSLIADLQWRGLFAAVKLIDDDYGDHFGINHFLPPQDEQLASRQRYVSAQLGQDLTLAPDLDLRFRVEALQHEHHRDHLYVFPADYFGEAPIYLDRDYREQRYLGAADLHWRG